MSALEVQGYCTPHLYLAPGAQSIPRFPTYVGATVRKLHATFNLPATLVWGNLDREEEHSSGKPTPWRVLLSHMGRNISPASAGQRVLTGLGELNVTLIIDGCRRSSNKRVAQAGRRSKSS